MLQTYLHVMHMSIKVDPSQNEATIRSQHPVTGNETNWYGPPLLALRGYKK
jgi:hypothetical protein